MSVTDVLVLQFLKTYGVPVLSILGLIVLITNNISLIRNKFLSRLVSKFDSASETLLVDYKKELFKPLYSIVSTDWKLRNKGLIRILEIGLRTGENVKYYPKNSHLLVVDRNVYIKTYLKSKPHLTSCINVENVTVSSGDNLRHIPDNSIDAVVGTFVLCSASRMDDLLHEIKRVLAPVSLNFATFGNSFCKYWACTENLLKNVKFFPLKHIYIHMKNRY
ncbi:hypothetical protein C0J52_20815 [Blattella germanica]|nr:hypothetical protein C0J52_20815 [Blattella germanica]